MKDDKKIAWVSEKTLLWWVIDLTSMEMVLTSVEMALTNIEITFMRIEML